MSDLVEVTVDGGVATVTLCDEERRNVLSAQLTSELVTHLDELDARGDVRVIVLTNRGSTFCAGADLSARGSSSTPAGAIDPVALFGRFATSKKPYVGRIDGHCVAGGMGLASALDISIAKRGVRFGFTEVRIGVAPAMISVVCLPKMRRADATELFLRGNHFDADHAAQVGLINRAVDPEELDRAVNEVVSDLLLGGPEALAACKQLLATVPTMDVREAFSYTKALSASLFASDEAREGMTAFMEKRPAPWASGE